MRLALPLLLVALLAPVALALPGPGVVVATGPGSHRYVTTGTCDDPDVSWRLQYSRAQETLILVGDSACVAPYWATIGGCRGGPRTEIICVRPGVRASLGVDGAFHLTWQGADFYEEIVAQLARVDV